MNPESRVAQMLKDAGAVLKRAKNHRVWLLPNGKNFVQASTPSDYRAHLNQVSDLKKRLDIKPEIKTSVSDRTVKPGVIRETKITPSVNTAMANALLISGAAERSLRNEIGNLQECVARQRQELAKFHAMTAGCWGCRARRRWSIIRRKAKYFAGRLL